MKIINNAINASTPTAKLSWNKLELLRNDDDET